MAELIQIVINTLAMSAEWTLSTVVTIFKGKSNIRNCSCNNAMQFLEHEVRVVEILLENFLQNDG